MLVNAVLDFPSQGATCKAETPNLPRDSPTWMPGFLLQGTEIVPHLKHLQNTINSVLISAH